MKSIEKYYDNTKDANPNYTIRKFIELNAKPGNVVEFGCGAGRDTVYLIRKWWNVLSIDREEVEFRITANLNEEELKYFKFSKQIFEDIELEKNNLVVTNFSHSFCNKNNFKELWNKMYLIKKYQIFWLDTEKSCFFYTILSIIYHKN